MCKSQKELVPTQARHLKPDEVKSYHSGMEVTIAWIPYQNQALKQNTDDEWVVVESDSAKVGAIPMILVKYPSGDSVWLDMNIKNEILGKLLKHSLMTQQPLTRPFGEFLETAKCTKCHPSDVEVDFDR